MTIKEIEKLFVEPRSNIKHAMEVIDKSGKGIALVIDDNKRLLGTVTDGDIRRAILKGISLEESVKTIMNEHYTFVTPNYSKRLVENIFEQKRINQIPVLDDNMRVVDIIFYHEFHQQPTKENWVVIMAGGLGTRLYPLTKKIPKPMLKVGAKPILETIIEQLKSFGYKNIILSLNYKGEIIQNYFQDGSNFGVDIKYVKEKKRLGTAGAIRLARKYLDKSFLVINGDILTKMNFEQFMQYHTKHKNLITIATRKYELEIPYGVVKIQEESVINLREKPTIEFFISGGIYCLEPAVIDEIPRDKYFDITELINIYLSKGEKVGSFPITEYWMDIGQMEDYNQANMDYEGLFGSEACATKE